MDLRTIGHYFITAGGVITVIAATLPDTVPGSPRTLALAAAGLCFAAGAFISRNLPAPATATN